MRIASSDMRFYENYIPQHKSLLEVRPATQDFKKNCVRRHEILRELRLGRLTPFNWNAGSRFIEILITKLQSVTELCAILEDDGGNVREKRKKKKKKYGLVWPGWRNQWAHKEFVSCESEPRIRLLLAAEKEKLITIIWHQLWPPVRPRATDEWTKQCIISRGRRHLLLNLKIDFRDNLGSKKGRKKEERVDKLGN